jgi:hypothetical protein
MQMKASQKLAINMQTMSVRLPIDDFEWLTSLDLSGATTPSDKLRALIAQMRRQHEGRMDYGAAMAWLREQLAPFVSDLRSVEHQHRTHSEPLGLALDWVPQILAAVLAERGLSPPDTNEARLRAAAIEDLVVDRSLRFAAALLRLAITRQTSSFQADVVNSHARAVLEMAQVIANNRQLPGERHE